jgi:hypothetical protein
MTEQPGVSERFPTASPWPLFVALGLALSELGLLLGFFPIAVGGVLLFGGAIAGILTEAEYVSHLWKTMGKIAFVLLAIGIALVVLQGSYDLSTFLAAVDAPNAAGHRLLSRGLAVIAAAVILVGTALAGQTSAATSR